MEKNPTIQLILNEVRRLRLVSNPYISQEKMAEHLNISQAAYNKIENGHTQLKHETLLLIAKKLEVPIEQFYKIAATSQISNTFRNA